MTDKETIIIQNQQKQKVVIKKIDDKILNISTNIDELDTTINNILVNIMSDVVRDISMNYNINLEELRIKYLSLFDKNEFYNKLITKLLTLNRVDHLNKFTTKQKEIKSKTAEINVNKCYARVQNGFQCCRNKKSGDFCGSHINNLPYGRIDEPQMANEMEIKKRGRPKGTGLSKKIDNDKNYFMEETDEGTFIICLLDNKVFSLPPNFESESIEVKDLKHVGYKVEDTYVWLD